jgi:hypothetical protein
MRHHGLGTLSEFLGDFVVYRNLVPMDPRLPSLAALRGDLGIPEGVTPRKSEPAYARVIVEILHRAQALWEAPLTRLIYVGDTRLNDGTAFANLCRAGGWPGAAFIGAERVDAPPALEVIEEGGRALMLANRWSLLPRFDAQCRARGLPVAAGAAVIVDLDKTALGARGRNDAVINAARVAAVRRTVAGALGAAFDAERFQAAYLRLNRTAFHPFTTDNQDYVAYLCLIVSSGLYDLDRLVAAIREGTFADVGQLLAAVDARADELPADLRALHADVYRRVRAGDPTPFKAFRYHEYETTVARMGHLPDDVPIADMLAREIVITSEVRAMALAWRARGALLFGLSDKPDEASLPSEARAAEGCRSLHETATHVVGAGGATDYADDTGSAG